MKALRLPPGDKRCQLLIAVSLLLVTALPGLALAEPQWWIQMKQDCENSGGQPSSRYYNDWVKLGGCICPGSSVGSGKATCDNSATASTGDSSGSSGGSDLMRQSATGMVKGIMSGNAQLTGTGILGMGVAAILQGSQPDPNARARQEAAEAAEAARQARIAELQRQAAEEELRRQEETKRRIIGMLKDSDPEPPSGELQLKMLDDPSDDLRKPGPMGSHLAAPNLQVVEGTPKLKGIDDDEKNDTLGTNASAGFDTAGKIAGANLDEKSPAPPTPQATDVPVPEDPEVKKEQLRVALKKNEEERKALQAVIETLKKSPAPDEAAIKQLQTMVTAKQEDQKKIEKEMVDLTATDSGDPKADADDDAPDEEQAAAAVPEATAPQETDN